MSEHSEDTGTTEVGWEQALAQSLRSESEAEAEEMLDEAPIETGDEQVEESAEDALEPHERWPEEVRTRFQSLDKETQQFLLDREGDVEKHLTQKTQELSEVQSKYKKLDDVLNPYDEVLRRQGVELAPHVGQALQHYFAYLQDPASTLKTLIQSSGLTPEQLGLVEDENTDPDIRALRSELAVTKRELAELKQGSTQQNQSALQSQIDSFANEKGEDGALKHPYFDRVRSLMAPLVDSGKSLETAYGEAVWSVPEYRESQRAAEQKSEEKARKDKAEKDRQEKLKKAREAETLPSSDTDKGNGLGEFKGWGAALQETLSKTE